MFDGTFLAHKCDKCMYKTSQKQIVIMINLEKNADLVEMRHNILFIQLLFQKFMNTPFTQKIIYTTLTNFSTKYLIMCKVYTDLGGIK